LDAGRPASIAETSWRDGASVIDIAPPTEDWPRERLGKKKKRREKQ
jgi:hypothetical protein